MSSKTSAMEDSIKDSGIKRQERGTELAYNSGLMAPNMKAYGRKIRPVAREE